MKAFDPNYKLLDEMYQDDYYPAFLVDKVKDELQKVIDLLESGETDTEVVQETLDEAVCGINDLQEEFDENDSEIETEMCIRDSKYHDIELHFDGKAHHGLHLIYSDDEIELSITAEHGEMLQPITNTKPVDNEFFLKDGAVYFSGLYENGLLKGVAPKDFCCWRYWGKSSTACFLGGIRLRGADPASFRVLNYAYAMDKTADVYKRQPLLRPLS